MPRAPTYRPQIREQALGNARVTTQAPEMKVSNASAQVTTALGNTAKEAHTFFEEQKKQADDLAALEIDSEVSQFSTDYLYNPQTGALNKKGKDAFAVSEDFEEKWRSKSEEIEGRLTNNAQRAAWSKIKASRYTDVDRQLQRHISVEAREYDNQVTESFLSNEREAAAAAYLDRERVDRSIRLQHDAVVKHAQRNGEPPEWVQQKSLDVSSKTHLSVLSRMVMTPGKELIAKDYFSKLEVGKDISAADAKSIEKLVHESSLRGESQRAADEIMGKYSDRGQALKAAGTMFKDKPELRQETEQRLEHLFSQKKQAESERRNDLYRQANAIVEGYLRKGQPIEPRMAVPPGIWNQLEPEAQKALESKGKDIPTDKQKYLEFIFLSQGQLAGLNDRDYDLKYRSHFSGSDQKTADSIIRAARTGDDKNQLLSSFSSYKDRLDDTLRSKSIVDPSNPKKRDEDAKLYADIALRARKRVEDFETIELQGKRRATGEEIQGILDDMVVTVRINEWGRDPKLPLATVTDEQSGQAYIEMKNIPQASQDALRRRMQTAGKKVTDDKIQRAYLAIKRGEKERAQAIIAE